MSRFENYSRPWERVTLKRGERPKGPLIAYDFETTPIPRRPTDDMRLEPRYLTAYGKHFRFSRAVTTYSALAAILREHFLVPELNRARFCAWNGNRFDARIVFEAVGEHLEEFIVEPYVAGKGGLRGACVTDRRDPKRSWQFLDGVSMTGLTGRSLAFFLDRFAPEFRKLEGVIDFEVDTFCATNPEHVRYAERDAEGLYHGLVRADEILRELSGRGIQVTIGNAGIKFLTSQLPEGVRVWPVRGELHDLMRSAGYRGGYVYVSRPYDGPVWSADINSAYPAAMREEWLPCGDVAATQTYDPDRPGAYVVRIARSARAPHPFYCKDLANNNTPIETFGEGVETFLLSPEIECLRRHGWSVDVRRGWCWMDRFKLTEMVDKLEMLRRTCEGGSGGAIGLMAKALGNNCYGKSGETITPLKIVIAKNCPETYTAYRIEEPTMRYYWSKLETEGTGRKNYHRPQIAAFITASVRCKLYEAIMLAPESFLKADTDSVAFSAPIGDRLAIDPTRFGAWKLEHDGDRHIILGKKVYAVCEGERWSFVCKGLSTRRLTVDIYERWYRDGCPPIQEQIQLQSWKASIELQYRLQARSGTDFSRTKARGRGVPIPE